MTALTVVGTSGATGSWVSALTSSARALIAGNHNFVFVAGSPVTPTTITVSDTAGNAYTALPQSYPGNNLFGQWFYCLNAVGNAANTVTAAFSYGVFSLTLRVIELSGDAPTVTQSLTSLRDKYGTPPLVVPDPGFSFGPGSAVLSGFASYQSTTATYLTHGNESASAWTEAYGPAPYGGVGYATFPDGASNTAPEILLTGTNASNALFLSLALGTPPAAGTAARGSQIATEILSTSTGLVARTSQLASEILRINTGTMIRASQVVAEVLRPNVEGTVSSVRPVCFVCT